MSSKGVLRRYARLARKKYRERARLFLAEGASLVRESPVPPVALFDDPGEIRRLSSLTTPTGPVAVFRFVDVGADELLSSGTPVVLLCGVQDPGNVGTTVRSAHAFGGTVALSKGCADLYNPKTVRATMGSIFHAPIARELDAAEFIQQASERGYLAVAAVPAGGVSPRNLPPGKILYVIGNEAAGLPEDVAAACRERVTIPSLAPSLNAAVAASILLYEARMRVLP